MLLNRGNPGASMRSHPIRYPLLFLILLTACTGPRESLQLTAVAAVEKISGSPEIRNLVASGSATDPTQTDFVSSGGNIYISWTATSGSATVDFGAYPITVSYSISGNPFVQLPGAFANGPNLCVVPPGATGCFTLANPAEGGTPIRFRLFAINPAGLTATGLTNTVNPNGFNFLAGNTESGLGGRAAEASLMPLGTQSLAVDTAAGLIYVLDKRGLMVVNKTDGLLKLAIPRTGVARDGTVGAAAGPTLQAPTRIALEYTGNPKTLLIRDTLSIRRFNAANGTLTTILTSDGVTNLVSEASNFNRGILTPLPNGDYIYAAGPFGRVLATSNPLRWYHAATGTQTRLDPTGLISIAGIPNQDISYCTLMGASVSLNLTNPASPSFEKIIFLISPTEVGTAAAPGHCYGTNITISSQAVLLSMDPTSFAPLAPSVAPPMMNATGFREFNNIHVTGMNGKLYLFGLANVVSYAAIAEYDSTANKWVQRVGMSTELQNSARNNLNTDGSCADATSPTSCAVSVTSLFVDPVGNLFFIDGNRIRTVLNNQVVTVAGQGVYFGDQGTPLNARISTVGHLETWNDGTKDFFVFSDYHNYRIREFTENGTIYTVTGTGTRGLLGLNTTYPGDASAPVPTSSIVNLQWHQDGSNSNFTIDGRGNIFTSLTTSLPVYQVVRNFQSWLPYGSALYPSSSYGPHVLGMNGTGKIAVGTRAYCGTSAATGGVCNGKIYELDSAGNSTLIVGREGSVVPHLSNFCLLSNTSTCVAPPTGSWGLASDYSAPNTFDLHMPHAQYDPVDGGWLFKPHYAPAYGRGKNVTKVLNGKIQTFTTFDRDSYGFAYVANSAGTKKMFYYCSADDGALYSRSLIDAIPKPDVKIPLNVPGMSCVSGSGGAVTYSPTRNSVVFSYSLNGLTGIAEFKLN